VDATHITNFYVLDGLLTREFDASWDALVHLVLPALALGTIPLAIIVRITRASVSDVQNEDYVRTADAKGLTASVIRRRHVLRNAMLPVLTTIGLQFGLLLSGAVLTETVFAFNGIGQYLFDAITQRDYPVLQGYILFIALVSSIRGCGSHERDDSNRPDRRSARSRRPGRGTARREPPPGCLAAASAQPARHRRRAHRAGFRRGRARGPAAGALRTREHPVGGRGDAVERPRTLR
jgi:hypothetical protein